MLWKQNKKYNEAEKTAIRMVYNTIQDLQGFDDIFITKTLILAGTAVAYGHAER